MKDERLSEMLYYSIVTVILCSIVMALGVPWQGVVPICVLLICVIALSMLRTEKGGPT